MTNNINSFLCRESSLRDLLEWRGYQVSSGLVISWGEFLVDVQAGTGLEYICWFFGTLRQNFWADHMIGSSNHRKLSVT